jgi:hypothetical protein
MLDLLAHDSKLPPKEEVDAAIVRFVERCEMFYFAQGVNTMLLDMDELFNVIETSFKYLLNYKEFSGFKAAAIFTLAMASKKPFSTSLSEVYGRIQAEHNIVIGILTSLHYLHGADLMTQEGTKTITNPIQFSDHYLLELVSAISFASQNYQVSYSHTDDKSKGCLTALVYEAVAYQSNPHIPYKDKSLNPLTELSLSFFTAGTDIKVRDK